MKLPQIDGVSEIETFTVTAGELRVTDPCYSMDTWCAGTLPNVMNGIWEAHVGYHKDSLDTEMGERWLEGEKKRIDEFAATHAKNGLGNFVQHEYDRLEEKRKEFAARPGRVSYIHIIALGQETHFDNKTELDSTWQLADIDVGVDSGQAGFFDVAEYAKALEDRTDGSRADKANSKFEAFYDSVCNLTLDDKSFGVVPFGCVSSSGYGDGGYNCYVRRNDHGQAIEAIIVFIDEPEEELDDSEAGEDNSHD